PPYVAAPAVGADGDPTSVAEEAIGCDDRHDMPASRAAATARGKGRMSLNLLRCILGVPRWRVRWQCGRGQRGCSAADSVKASNGRKLRVLSISCGPDRPLTDSWLLLNTRGS